MDYIEVSGKTVDEALTEALVQLGLTSDQVEYDVIEKGSSGFLGFNSKPAVLHVRKKSEPQAEEVSAPVEKAEKKAAKAVEKEAKKEEKKEAKAEKKEVKAEAASDESTTDQVKTFLDQVFDAMDMEVEILMKEEDNVVDVELKGKDMGVLIGKRGQTLDALQYLTNLVVNKHSNHYTKVKLDTEDYRNRRKETLENLAKNIAYKVKRTKKSVSLEPMNPFERRVIHSALQGDRYVETHSEGQEPYRHVVVTLKNSDR